MTLTPFEGRSPETLDLLLRRRSASAKALREPGPDSAALALILRAGTRVPDHGKLAPWRFLLFEGQARRAAGEVLAEAFRSRETSAGETQIAFERGRFLRAPCVLAVISSPKAGTPIPEWEQRLSSAAVCQTMLIAATALGLGAQWITEWYAYDAAVARAFGLDGEERFAGFLYLGTPAEPLSERPRPDPESLLERWTGSVA